MVMRAREHIYHLDCFACQVCRYRFCVGDRFYLHLNAVLCEDHYCEVRGYLYPRPLFTWLNRGRNRAALNATVQIAFTNFWLLQFQNELTHIYLAWKHVAPITDWPVWKLLSKQRRTGMGSALWNFECVVVTTHDLHCNNSNNNDNNYYWSRNKEQSRFQSRKTILISSRTMLKFSILKPVVLTALLWWKNANTFQQRRFKVLSWTDESKGCASEATTNFKPS